MSEPNQSVRLTVLFRGHVQGVGFRYTTERIARAFAVTGYVRNLPDGRVEIEAEGEPDVVNGFLAKIETNMKHYIRERIIQEGPATGQFSGFSIQY